MSDRHEIAVADELTRWWETAHALAGRAGTAESSAKNVLRAMRRSGVAESKPDPTSPYGRLLWRRIEST